MSNFANNDNMTALFTATGTKISERAKIFYGAEAEWNALPLSEKIKYDYVAFAGDSQSGIVDDVPTEDSENLVKSGGVFSELATKANLTQISNPNLLDNPWFTINQRGSTSYTLAQSNYGFDRWYANAGGESISKSDGIISLDGSSTNQYSGICQRIERDRLEVGKTYTLSVLFSDGEIEYKTFTLASSGSGFLGEWNHAPKFNATIISSSSDTLWAILPFDALTNLDATASFKAIKLEKGSVSTLAMDTAPNYATELLKCQRYFIRFYSVLLLPGTVHNNGSFRFIVYAKMRAQPTVSIHDATMHDLQVICNQTAQRLTDSQTMSVQNYTTEEITIMFDSLPTTQPNYSIGLFKLLAGALDLSADL